MQALIKTLNEALSPQTLARSLGWGTGRTTPSRRQRCCGQHRAAQPRPGAPASEPQQPGSGGACGWYDSSHELQRGLVVTEYRGAEGLAAELPLSVWLALATGSAGTQGCASLTS